jgi:hypothetical protein
VKAHRPLGIPVMLAWTTVVGGALGAAVSCSSSEVVRGVCPSAETTADASGDAPGDVSTDVPEDATCDAPVYVV